MTEEPTMNGALYTNLTLADLIALVIDAVEATCQGCGGIWRAPFHYLPPTTRLHTPGGGADLSKLRRAGGSGCAGAKLRGGFSALEGPSRSVRDRSDSRLVP